jgi:hypothetical protein
VKVPRFRIAWVMVGVAIAALDFAEIRAFLGPHPASLGRQKHALLLLGALPMGNVLAVGMLTGQCRRGSRPFHLGFEAFGAMALTLFIALAVYFPREVVMSYLTPVVDSIDKVIWPNHPFVLIATQGVVAVVMLGWPQLVFAVIGGFLFRKFKTTSTPP